MANAWVLLAFTLASCTRPGAGLEIHSRAGGSTPMLRAVEERRAGSVRMLLENHADPNGRGNRGVTPLMVAAGYGYTEIVEILLDRGADPRIRSDRGQNALDAAVGGIAEFDRFTVGRCRPEAVRLLLDAYPGLSGSAAPLSVARFAGCSEVLELLGYTRSKR